MYIDNPEALRTWLTGILEPLCDADPAALAKYVLALAKKDKPEPELKATMLDQLEVFLQKETARFVELLFAALQDKSYLDSSAVPAPLEAAPLVVEKVKEEVNVPTELPRKEVIKDERKEQPVKEKEDKRQKSTTEKHRTRSRSRSRDHGRNRSRSPRRDRDRSRNWERRHSPVRREGRDFRRKSRSPVRRSKSPRTRNRAYRSGSRSWSPHRRSVSPRRPAEPATEAKKGSEKSSGGATPTQDSNHGVSDEFRLATTAQSIQSVVVTATGGIDKPKWRCRDFDEKGFCMRGDLCLYDHGTDPVVLEDVELSSVLSYGNSRANSRPGETAGRIAPPDVSAPPPAIAAQPLPPATAPGEQYNPAAPSIGWSNYTGDPRGPPPLMLMRPMGPRPMGNNFGVPPPFFNAAVRGAHKPVGPPFLPLAPPQMPSTRELISVPMQDSRPPSMKVDRKRPAGEPTSEENFPEGYQERPKRRHFDYSRLGNRRYDGSCCSLEVKKIPKGLNNISQLNNHFSKFGKIVNLQVSFNGDPEAALVSFMSHAEAQAAYRSTEAVLNNRFIKVFWHNPVSDSKQENLPPTTKPSAKERLGKLAIEEEMPVIDEEKDKEKEMEREKAVAAIRKSQEILAAKESLRKKQEDKKREAVKLQSDLQRRKQDLLEKQLQQQRILIERFEKSKNGLKSDERSAIMTTIKHLQDSVEGLKRDLSHTATAVLISQKDHKMPPSLATSSVKKAVHEARKVMLDVDMDLYQKPEVTEEELLQSKMRELKRNAIELGLASSGRGMRGRGRGRASRARGRSFYVPPHVSVDRRPTALLISGFESEDQGDVLSHFAQYGDIVDHLLDDSVPSLVVHFKIRKEAEMAAVKGKNFRDRVLAVNWHMPAKVREDDREEDEQSEQPDDDVLNYEEEEEDVEEERSWRR